MHGRVSLPGVRWVAPEYLHLTLRFLGDVNHAVVPDLNEALGEISAAPVCIRCQGLDLLNGADKRPRAIVRSVEANPALAGLQRAVERAQASVGRSERRRFRPHVTLARIRRSARLRQLRDCIEMAGILPAVAWVADSFVLYASHLGRDGAAYTEEAVFPLGTME